MDVIAFFTLLGQIGLLGLLALYVVSKRTTIPFVKQFFFFLQRNGLWIAFLIAFVSTFGSLYLSEILELPPCTLCWYQRALMYPQTIILLVAAVRKHVFVKDYIIPLSIIGGMIASYHYFIQRFPAVAASCGISSESCTTVYEYYYGYITIPVMALTGFVLTALFTILGTRFLNKSEREVNVNESK
ncbi:disulfide bond formation protein B [bacterium]|uniref:Disulfide bond formation protein B n=2 Tax=Katanobacteria TaxID=422282 RepID=A0A2M7X246_UNCKA|nr:disulfide bond formation protein B [bacterium]PIP56172.1 MAG: disulfide bond formation protein B [candidate division WWE3 bacterium CG22_combo_CG10-13_8_21_14_all_39_12]PJA40071.1 MAG: disulfide bond formation protein B [candidate division WWE3 bacterium CG_4_9_14_3_um_filter_39_7]